MSSGETIFALSSGRLPSGVAVVRVSGAKTTAILENLVGFVPSARVMHYGPLRGAHGNILDRCLSVFYPGPNSVTGEDCAEFQLHGGIAVVNAVSAELECIPGVRYAEAGEFTKRAFLNGKLDLAEAEGLGDLIAAETEAQRRLALQQTDGLLSNVYAGWRANLVHCRAMAEAAIDFSDEDDVDTSVIFEVLVRVDALAHEMRAHLERSACTEMVRDGLSVVILGAPNAGKSSLLNALAGRDVAIASDEAGTTRDLIDVRLDLAGNLVIFTDTAGIREAAGKVESIGIERALERASRADVVLLLVDLTAPIDIEIETSATLVLRIGNKSDLLATVPSGCDFVISTQTGFGLDTLIGRISDFAASSVGVGEILVVQQRQKALISGCLEDLTSLKSYSSDLELVAECLRRATGLIGRLTGDVGVEELLGVIFSRFCIGK